MGEVTSSTLHSRIIRKQSQEDRCSGLGPVVICRSVSLLERFFSPIKKDGRGSRRISAIVDRAVREVETYGRLHLCEWEHSRGYHSPRFNPIEGPSLSQTVEEDVM